MALITRNPYNTEYLLLIEYKVLLLVIEDTLCIYTTTKAGPD
jgi:hypothetical protein